MTKSLIDIYSDELRFLLKLKESVGILNNRIHDKLALIAIEKLEKVHPKIKFEYRGAGAGGIDIEGFSKDRTKKIIQLTHPTRLACVDLRRTQSSAT